MSQNFQPGDFLVFQLEAGFALLRLLALDELDHGTIWHLAAYSDFFLDVESAEVAALDPNKLTLRDNHMAITNRAFESTQVARLTNVSLTSKEMEPLKKWRIDPDSEVSDRSVRLLLGLR
ncbi:MAG: hypothetical protein ACKVQJ_11825 [Pyrinomonadaceae bacterium]